MLAINYLRRMVTVAKLISSDTLVDGRISSEHLQLPVSKQPLPPITWQPKKPLMSILVNKFSQQHCRHQLQHHHQQQSLNLPVFQKSRSLLVQHQLMISPPTLHVQLKTSNPAQKLVQQSPVMTKHFIAVHPQVQQPKQIKSNFPSKSPIASTVTDIIQQQQHHQPSTHCNTCEQGHMGPQSHPVRLQQQPTFQHQCLSHKSSGQRHQVKPFFSCMNRFFKKFRKKSEQVENANFTLPSPLTTANVITPERNISPSSRDRGVLSYKLQYQQETCTQVSM